LKTKDSRASRPLIVLIVLISHAVIMLVVIREDRLASSAKRLYEPLLVMLLDGKASEIKDAAAEAPQSRSNAVQHKPVPHDAITLPPEMPGQPKIDWEHESELATQNFIADAEKEKAYRNLSGLSADQLDWIKKNHMKPAPPGFEWQHPRFEFDPNSGLPMFWISDHCVLITLMIFCGIGHSQANGSLFQHMRDTKPP